MIDAVLAARQVTCPSHIVFPFPKFTTIDPIISLTYHLNHLRGNPHLADIYDMTGRSIQYNPYTQWSQPSSARMRSICPETWGIIKLLLRPGIRNSIWSLNVDIVPSFGTMDTGAFLEGLWMHRFLILRSSLWALQSAEFTGGVLLMKGFSVEPKWQMKVCFLLRSDLKNELYVISQL